MAWRVAKALDTLRSQINERAPNRSEASDGTIGDAAHAATKSGHNPNAAGHVVAMDITHDPANGCDCNAIFASLIAGKDPRLQYLIWNRQIVNREVSPWVVRPYNGANPHDKHIHIEVDEKIALYDDPALWAVRVTTTPSHPASDVEPAPPRPTSPPVTTTDVLGGAIAATSIGAGAWLWNALGWVGLVVIVCGVLAGIITYATRKKRG